MAVRRRLFSVRMLDRQAPNVEVVTDTRDHGNLAARYHKLA